MGAGASAGINSAIQAATDNDLKDIIGGLDAGTRAKLLAAANQQDPAVAAYVEDIKGQWQKILDNPDKVLDTAASKRSPFKFDRGDSNGAVDLRLGISAVALPNPDTDFGKRYLAMIDSVQDLFKKYMPRGCKRQVTPHMSLGSVVLDKSSPQEYNAEIERRTGLSAKVKEYLDSIDVPARAKIQILKINPDGCVTLQLEHDPAQDTRMTEAEFEEALRKVPTCSSDEAAAKERKRYKKNEDGTYTVTRFQQLRLGLGELGCEIKGMYPSGHMVVVNLVCPRIMAKVNLDELMAGCYKAFAPLIGEWFELKKVIQLCYVERSLNEGSVVLAPDPGAQPKAFPEGSKTAEALLGGMFTATPSGDVLIDIEKFEKRRSDKGTTTWQVFRGEVREMAENATGVDSFLKAHPEEELEASFKLFDKDGSGHINTKELGHLMEKLGEKPKEDELNKMIQAADDDGTGNICFVEFVQIMSSK